MTALSAPFPVLFCRRPRQLSDARAFHGVVRTPRQSSVLFCRRPCCFAGVRVNYPARPCCFADAASCSYSRPWCSYSRPCCFARCVARCTICAGCPCCFAALTACGFSFFPWMCGYVADKNPGNMGTNGTERGIGGDIPAGRPGARIPAFYMWGRDVVSLREEFYVPAGAYPLPPARRRENRT